MKQTMISQGIFGVLNKNTGKVFALFLFNFLNPVETKKLLQVAC